MNLLVFIVTGAVAGWLAATLVKGRGFGPAGNIILGVVGSLLGGFLFDFFGIQPGGIPGYFMAAVVGSVSLLVIVGLLKNKP
ncbi:MAG: GlsB/YeaQ/YmgE family stress response membrane protein [Gammaproteobacteria bacterium]